MGSRNLQIKLLPNSEDSFFTYSRTHWLLLILPSSAFPDSELVFRDSGGGLSILDVDTDLQRQIVSNKIFVSCMIKL